MKVIQDLAEYNNLISSVFKQLKTKEEWDQYRLSEEQVKYFNEFGYVSGIKLLEENHIDLLRTN